MDGIGRQLARAAMWTAIARYSGFAVQLIVVAILARLLEPRDFGVIGVVMVFAGFMNMFADAGMSAVIVHRTDVDERALSTLFWFGVMLATVLIGVTWAGAPALARFVRIVELTPVLRVFAISFLFVAVVAIPDGLLRRRLAFERLTAAQIAAAVLAGVTGVALAWAGARHWAIVGMVLAHTTANFFLLAFAARWWPALLFDGQMLRESIHFSTAVTLSSVLTFSARTVDDLLIGRVHGPVQLGYYTQPYRMAIIAQDFLAGVVGPTLQPVFSRNDDLASIRSAFGRVLRLVMWLTFPVAVLLALNAADIIRTVFGPGWEPAIPVLQWLAIVVAAQAPGMLSGAALVARGRSRMLLVVTGANSIVFIIAFFASVQSGIVALTQTYAATNLLMMPLALWLTWRYAYDGGAGELLDTVWRPLGVAAACAIAAIGLNVLLSAAPALLRLACSGSVVALIALFTLHRNDPDLLKALRRQLRNGASDA